MPENVLRLKSRVPTNWIAALHHEGSDPHLLPRLSVACRNARPAASVKKIKPTKKVTRRRPDPQAAGTLGTGRRRSAPNRSRSQPRSSDPRPPSQSDRTSGSAYAHRLKRMSLTRARRGETFDPPPKKGVAR